MDAKQMEVVERVGKRIITAIECEFNLMQGDEYSDPQLMSMFQIAVSLSTGAFISSLANTFPNYKSRTRYIELYKQVINETLDNALKNVKPSITDK